jgi:hypothetical protein
MQPAKHEDLSFGGEVAYAFCDVRVEHQPRIRRSLKPLLRGICLFYPAPVKNGTRYVDGRLACYPWQNIVLRLVGVQSVRGESGTMGRSTLDAGASRCASALF